MVRRLLLVVPAVAALVGCGTLANRAESPTFQGHASGNAAVLTVECDRAAPATVTTVSGTKMKALLSARHVEVAAPADAALFCSTYGRGMGAIDGFGVPANVASALRATAKSSGSATVLVNVVAYNRGCSDHEPKCEKSIDGATVRGLLFSADGAMLWKKWDFAPENAGEAERAFSLMFADVPVDKLVSAASAPKPETTPLVAAAITPPEPVAAAPAAEAEPAPAPEPPPPPAKKKRAPKPAKARAAKR